MTNSLSARISELESKYSGRLGMAALNIRTGERYLLRSDETFATASLIKVAIAVAALRKVDKGELDVDKRYAWSPALAHNGSGIMRVLDGGITPTLRDLLTLMIAVSDNSATNMVLDAIGGTESVNAALADIHVTGMTLFRRMDVSPGDDIRELAVSTPAAMLALISKVRAGSALTPESSRLLCLCLRRQYYLDLVCRYLAVDWFADRPGSSWSKLDIGCKTGFFPGCRTDAGFVEFDSGGGFLYAVFHEGSDDETYYPESEGAVLLGLIGRILLEEWWTGAPESAPLFKTRYVDI